MQGFDRDAFGAKILSMYDEARENNYILKLDEHQIRELKSLYIELYIPMEKLSYYDDEQITKKMMTAIVSVYTLDKDANGNTGEVVQLVDTVQYDGKSMYLKYARISPVKMRRFAIGKTRQQVAEKMGYSVAAVKNCETPFCDLSRQPETLILKLAKALECEPENLF